MWRSETRRELNRLAQKHSTSLMYTDVQQKT